MLCGLDQVLNALVFMYKAVLDKPLGDLQGVIRAKKPRRLPVVLSSEEVAAVLHHLEGIHWLAACLLYGSGLRLMECMRLRVISPLGAVPGKQGSQPAPCTVP